MYLISNQEQSCQENLFSFERDMVDLLNETEVELWDKPEGGGFAISLPQMMEYLEGIQPALYFFAGQTNLGKTMFLLRIAWDLATLNSDVHVRYYTIDDHQKKIIPRVISMNTDVSLSLVEKPTTHQHNALGLRKREEGFALLIRNASRFSVVGEDKIGGTDLEYIERDIAYIAAEIEKYNTVNGTNKRLIICIDSYHRLSSNKSSVDRDRYIYIVNRLKSLVNNYRIPILATAEMRKTDGYSPFRRPVLNDLRETCESLYRADVVALCYSEVGIGKPNPKIYHTEPQALDIKLPVLELHFAKNKTSDFKGRLFYKQYPAKSKVVEATREEVRKFSSLI